MRLIDADKFLSYLIYSKHIDSLTCKEVKEAVEICKVDVLEDIKAEIEATIDEEKAGQGNVNKGVVIGLQMTLTIIDKHISGEEQGRERMNETNN